MNGNLFNVINVGEWDMILENVKDYWVKEGYGF